MRNILLVEDNESAVTRIRQYIKNISTDLDVIAFSEAGKALEYARSTPVSLFIINIQLEDYKGTRLVKQLRELPEYKYTPIIFETALAGEEMSAYRDVKCYGFLIKPFYKTEFQSVFCDAMGLSDRISPSTKTIQLQQKQFILE